jgi:hypothetical protein
MVEEGEKLSPQLLLLYEAILRVVKMKHFKNRERERENITA